MDMYQKREQRKKNKEENKDETKGFSKSGINWYPGHMTKARREIEANLNLIDIVYEVIDARMPISSKIADIDNLIKDKLRILIVTKYDICDKPITDQLLEVYKNDGYEVIEVDLVNNINVKKIVTKTIELTKDLNEIRKKKGLKPRSARALVIGVPNAGKSTLINRLVGKKAVQTGDRPGVTKGISWIRINKDVELMDSPGILWPKIESKEVGLNLAALSSIKEEIIDKEELAAYIVNRMIELYPNSLKDRYKLDNFNDIFDIIAKKSGFITNKETDYEKVYIKIINDLKKGYFGNITLDR